MCLSIPSKVVNIDKERNVAVVDTMGVTREAGLELMQENEVQIGDYVLLHIGFIMNKIDEADAVESLKVYNEILQKLDEEERQQVMKDDDKCQNRAP